MNYRHPSQRCKGWAGVVVRSNGEEDDEEEKKKTNIADAFVNFKLRWRRPNAGRDASDDTESLS